MAPPRREQVSANHHDPVGSLLSQTRAVLRQHGLAPQRLRGQNFLIDRRVRDRILTTAGVDARHRVVEIGPGTGSLTEGLLARGAAVLAVEVDRGLAALLAERWGNRPGFQLETADALRFDFAEALATERRPIRVVANIPYHITSPLILHLLSYGRVFEALFLTVQKEVAVRMAAGPGDKSYGAFTLACQYRAAVQAVFRIPPTAFFPVPEVDSMLVRLDPHAHPPIAVSNPDTLILTVRTAFGVRRKTLRNALLQRWPGPAVDAALHAADLDGRRRGETLSLDEFGRLSDALPAGPACPVQGEDA
ncbi:MAG TPA: 16S rRNA (adenine(1518)-N(6)/adenine(1519)-N(6))-dimethyltransferase RsmA [Candidatus Baltobacteraceae bacterium]|nr:16S rRNA (adenine(1518)-N(6)/adenine(1519)-N(6))-dimethyltransferase RsmA [Candidatus Baltobacteraceae bacterium]